MMDVVTKVFLEYVVIQQSMYRRVVSDIEAKESLYWLSLLFHLLFTSFY